MLGMGRKRGKAVEIFSNCLERNVLEIRNYGASALLQIVCTNARAFTPGL